MAKHSQSAPVTWGRRLVYALGAVVVGLALWGGLRLLLDGRRVTDPARFTGVPRLTIGGGEPAPA